MIIKDQHIREAENILIDGDRFDNAERIPFIKNLNSCDLLAVPGSGKTTALLAKLFCISKELPFDFSSGILVLSHTNAAVNEIENNLKKYCPRLFEYPNFVGTIQSFVNKFLANSFCFEKYGSYIRINDNDIYENEVNKFYYSLKWSRKNVEPKNLKNKLLGLVNAGKKVEFSEGCSNIIDFLKWFDFNIRDRKLIYNNRTILKYDSANKDYYLSLEEWKTNLFRKGVLNFNDSYNFGKLFVDQYPQILQILQKRFKYVFIDEMQDLEKFQIDIIDSIFLEGDFPSTIQRIGDINQSIYSSGKRVKVESDWIPRNQLYLKGSNRLTPENAKIVNFFTLDRQNNEEGQPRFLVNGLRILDNPIKPHLLLFEKDSMCDLEDKFKELVIDFSLHKTREGKKYGFKIIGWNARWDNENTSGKLRLENIFSSYKKEAKTNRETYDSLSKYLQLFDQEKKTLEAARKTVLNALIHILRLESKTNTVRIRGKDIDRYYTKDELIKFIKDSQNNCDYEYFKKFIFACSKFLAIKKKPEVVYKKLTDFIVTDFKDWFSLTINSETLSFLGNKFDKIKTGQDNKTTDDESDKDIKVDIGTVHSAKGQTHCATMYVETSYYEYETEKARINEALKKEEHRFVLTDTTNKRGKQALKMMYVGFSRPTHLLCFACLKENIKDDLELYKSAGWEVIDLTTKDDL